MYARDIFSLAILYLDDSFDVEDLLLLPELGTRLGKHHELAERWARHGKQLDYASLPPDQCKSLFRFENCDIPGLVEAVSTKACLPLLSFRVLRASCQFFSALPVFLLFPFGFNSSLLAQLSFTKLFVKRLK